MTVANYDRQELKALRLAGVPVVELMARYGVSESTIRTRLHRMGVKLPPEINAARSSATMRAWRSDPANEAKRHAHAAAQWTAERKAAQGDTGRQALARRVAWCPAAYRRAYDHLLKSKRLLAADARRIIEADIAADLARETARRVELGSVAQIERAMAARCGGGRRTGSPLRLAQIDPFAGSVHA